MRARYVLYTTVLVALVIGVAGLGRGESQDAPRAVTPPRVGDMAPDFSLDTLDGRSVRLSTLRETGPVVVLVLRGWVGYHCPVCTRQVGQYLGAAADFAALDANVVLIYPASGDIVRERAGDFITGQSLPANVHFVLDPDLSLVNRYGVRWEAPDQNAYPSTFVVDRQGTVRFAHVGTSASDRPEASVVLGALARLD